MNTIKPQHLLTVLITFFLLFFSFGCGSNAKVDNSNYAYSVKDSQGYTLNFKAKPTRIVSLSISTDEILLDLLPAKDIIAITKYADDSGISNVTEKAKAIPNRVDGTSAEKILSLQPDLVIVPDFVKPEMIKSLRDMQLNVYVYKTPSTIDEVKNNIKELAKLVGEPTKADPLIAYMDERLNKVQKVLGTIPEKEQKSVAFMQDNGVYYSPNSSFRSICQAAQVYDITSSIKEDHSFTLTQEKIVALNPQAFVLADWNYDGKHSEKDQINNILSNKAFENVTAWQQKDFIVIPASKLLALSPYIADAVLLLAEKAYPEKFKQ